MNRSGSAEPGPGAGVGSGGAEVEGERCGSHATQDGVESGRVGLERRCYSRPDGRIDRSASRGRESGRWPAGRRSTGWAVVPIEELLPRLTVLTRNIEKLYLPISPPDNVEKARSELESRDSRYLTNPLSGRIPETKQVANLIRQLLPQLRLVDVNSLLDRLRWTKTPYEIERMRRSSQISAEGVNEAIKGTRPGMYEYELEAAARFVFTRRGARGEAFTPIVALGPNSITRHYTANDRRVEAGDLVVMERRDHQVHLRLEDTILITPTGAENLTAGVAAEIDELYVLIKKRALTP